MKRIVSLVTVVLAVVVLLGGVAPVCAQEISIASIPFSFTANNKVMPAGNYEITVTDQGILTVTPAKGAAVAVPVITRLASQGNAADARFVFDKVENTYYLSEVWFPTQDGFLVRDTKQPHTHHTVKGQKKRS